MGRIVWNSPAFQSRKSDDIGQAMGDLHLLQELLYKADPGKMHHCRCDIAAMRSPSFFIGRRADVFPDACGCIF